MLYIFLKQYIVYVYYDISAKDFNWHVKQLSLMYYETFFLAPTDLYFGNPWWWKSGKHRQSTLPTYQEFEQSILCLIENLDAL